MAGNGVNGMLYEQFRPQERFSLLLEAMARGDEAEADRVAESCPRRTYTQRDVAFQERVDTAFDLMAVVCIDLRGLTCKLQALRWATAVARDMATHHQITGIFALMEGERLGKGQPQLKYFTRKGVEGPAGPSKADDVDDDLDPRNDENEHESRPHFSDCHRGDLATRMMAVEDRMQAMTDLTFAALLHAAERTAMELNTVWTAFERFCRSRLGTSAEMLMRAWQMPQTDELHYLLSAYASVSPDEAKTAEYTAAMEAAWDRRMGG